MGNESRWRQRMAEIMTAALQAVDPGQAVRRQVRREGDWLYVAGQRYDLGEFERVFVVGGGKAGSPMALAVADVLGDRLTAGVVNVKHGYIAGRWQVSFGAHPSLPALQTDLSSHLRSPEPRLDIVEAGHPVPDAAGLAGAERIFRLLDGLTERDLVICLISGGGSALLPLPAAGITLDDLQALTTLLLRCGATINEFNAVRKHCSRLKGGQLARRAAPAALVCLILSDVVGSPLDTIASGPTVADPTTFADAYGVLERYGILEAVPDSIVAHLRRGLAGEVAETPKPGDPCFRRVQNVVIGDNRMAAHAAQARAQALGFRSQVLTTYVEGEAREVAKVCAALAKEMVESGTPLAPPACLILGGETTVTVRGQGRGGRNQELALAAALALDGWERTMVVSLATDGSDGPTDAAGAVATGSTVARARALGLDPAAHLANNDAYPFFAALGDLIFTGPTNTNVNDLVFVCAF
ncbi:MAG: glycerate kinase [Anaerolineae bacterium]|nr:glycerate kinase [Anaerolineae bacterium]